MYTYGCMFYYIYKDTKEDKIMNPSMLMKLGKAKNEFNANHPKFAPFLSAVNKTSLVEGTVIEITVTRPTGEQLKTNLKLKESDIELLKSLQ